MRKFSKSLVLPLTGLLMIALSGIALSGSKKDDKGKGYLGVYLEDITKGLRESLDFKGDGVFIDDIVDDSPAQKAGFEPGDIVIKYAGKGVEDTYELRKMIKNTKPDTKVEIDVIRDGKEKTLSAKIGERKEYADSGIKVFPKGIGKKRIHIYTDHECDSDDCCDNDYFVKGHKDYWGKRAFLGVNMDKLSEGLADYFEVKYGALITDVVEGSAAEKVGMKPGDVIIEYRGREVREPEDVSHYIKKNEVGDEVEVKIIRKGKEMSFKVTLGENPKKSKDMHGLYELENNYKLHQLELGKLEEQLEILDESIGDMNIDLRFDGEFNGSDIRWGEPAAN